MRDEGNRQSPNDTQKRIQLTQQLLTQSVIFLNTLEGTAEFLKQRKRPLRSSIISSHEDKPKDNSPSL